MKIITMLFMVAVSFSVVQSSSFAEKEKTDVEKAMIRLEATMSGKTDEEVGMERARKNLAEEMAKIQQKKLQTIPASEVLAELVSHFGDFCKEVGLDYDIEISGSSVGGFNISFKTIVLDKTVSN